MNDKSALPISKRPILPSSPETAASSPKDFLKSRRTCFSDEIFCVETRGMKSMAQSQSTLSFTLSHPLCRKCAESDKVWDKVERQRAPSGGFQTIRCPIAAQQWECVEPALILPRKSSRGPAASPHLTLHSFQMNKPQRPNVMNREEPKKVNGKERRKRKEKT